MGHHVPGDESPFLKRVLIPFWVVRILIMVIDIIIYGLAIGGVAAYENNTGGLKDKVDNEIENNDNIDTSNIHNYSTIAIAIMSVVMVIIIICLVLDIVCIVKRKRRTLTPRFFLITNVVQTAIWTAFFVLYAFGIQSAVSIVIGVIVYLSFLGLLIYASVVFHRSRKGLLGGGKYAPTTNPGHGQQLLAEDTSYGVHSGFPYGQPVDRSYSPQSSFEKPREPHEVEALEMSAARPQ